MSSNYVLIDRAQGTAQERRTNLPNTVAVRHPDRSVSIRLYETDVVRWHPDDTCVLRCDGYVTNLTATRINTWAPLDVFVRIRDGRFVITTRSGQEHTWSDPLQPITIDSRGEIMTATATESPTTGTATPRVNNRPLEERLNHPRRGDAVIDRSGDCWMYNGHVWVLRTRPNRVDATRRVLTDAWQVLMDERQGDRTVPTIYAPYRLPNDDDVYHYRLEGWGVLESEVPPAEPEPEPEPEEPYMRIVRPNGAVWRYWYNMPWWSVGNPYGHNRFNVIVGLEENPQAIWAQPLRNWHNTHFVNDIPEGVRELQSIEVSHASLRESGLIIPEPTLAPFATGQVRRWLPQIVDATGVQRFDCPDWREKDHVLLVARNPFSPLATLVTPDVAKREKMHGTLVGWYVLEISMDQWKIAEGLEDVPTERRIEVLQRTLRQVENHHEELRESIRDNAISAAENNGRHEFLQPVKEYLEDLGYDPDELPSLRKEVTVTYTITVSARGFLAETGDEDEVGYSSLEDAIDLDRDSDTGLTLQLDPSARIEMEDFTIEDYSVDVSTYDVLDYED